MNVVQKEAMNINPKMVLGAIHKHSDTYTCLRIVCLGNDVIRGMGISVGLVGPPIPEIMGFDMDISCVGFGHVCKLLI